MATTLVWVAFLLALAAARAGARVYGHGVSARLAAERQEEKETEEWIQKLRAVAL